MKVTTLLEAVGTTEKTARGGAEGSVGAGASDQVNAEPAKLWNQAIRCGHCAGAHRTCDRARYARSRHHASSSTRASSHAAAAGANRDQAAALIS